MSLLFYRDTLAVGEEMQAEKIKKHDFMSYVLAVNLSLAQLKCIFWQGLGHSLQPGVFSW